MSQVRKPKRLGFRTSSSDASVIKRDRKSTRLNSSHVSISYAVFCLKKKSGLRADGDLVHVHAGAGVEHRAPFAHRDHRDRVAATERRGGGAVDGVDGDVDGRRRAVA